jgi:hypothetical protein
VTAGEHYRAAVAEDEVEGDEEAVAGATPFGPVVAVHTSTPLATKVTVCAGTPPFGPDIGPIWMLVAVDRLVPVMVTTVPPRVVPYEGETPVTVGIG